jgi:hypothetical protein
MSRKFSSGRVDSDLEDKALKRYRSPQTRHIATKSVTPTSGSRPFAGYFTPKSRLYKDSNDSFIAKVDKERLYEEVLTLKQTVNKLSQENTRLKTKATLLQRKLVKSEVTINELKSYSSLKWKNLNANAELSLMRLKETDELQTYSEEAARMKPSPLFKTEALGEARLEVSKWRSRVFELEKAGKKQKTHEALKQEVRKLKSSLETMRKTAAETQQTAAEAEAYLEKKLQSVIAEADRLKRELDLLRLRNAEEMMKNAALTKSLGEVTNTNKDLTQRYEALRETTGFSAPEAQNLALSIYRRLEESKESLEQFAAEATDTRALVEVIERTLAHRNIRAIVEQVFKDLQVTPSRVLRWLTHYSPKPRVNLFLDLTVIKQKQVEDLVKHVSLRMQLHRHPKRSLIKVMFGDLPRDSVVSHEKLVTVFKSAPFSMPQAESDMISYFLLDKHNTAGSLAGYLMFELEDWEVLDPQDEESLDKEIAEIIKHAASDLKAACKALDTDNSGTILSEEFNQVVDDLGLAFTDKQLQYLKLLFYSHNYDCDHVPYLQLLNAYIPDSTELVNSCLAFVSNALHSQGKTAGQVFAADAQGLVRTAQFYFGLQQLGHPQLERNDLLAIMEALSCDGDEEEVCIHIDYFNELLGHFSQSEASSEGRETYISVLDSNESLSSLQ